MAVDILFVSHNRLAYTRESFTALIDNTYWDDVSGVFIADDLSTDGTAQWLTAAADDAFSETHLEDHWWITNERFGGPVNAINWYLDQAELLDRPDDSVFVKIDNDFIVCPGWLQEMTGVLTLNPDVDILGFEPRNGPAIPCPATYPNNRHALYAEFIGGKGLIRRRAFEHCRPTRLPGLNGYQGFTQWQMKHDHIVKAWVRPDLPVFGIDQLPERTSWRQLAYDYTAKGWSRNWDAYPDDAIMQTYYDWWTPAYEAVWP